MAILRPLAFLAAVAAFAGACTSPRHTEPPVRELYRAAARREARNPVVVVHGILGARLEQRSTHKTVWGAFTSDGIDLETPEGARALAMPLLPQTSATAYDPATADVFPSGPLEAIRLGI